MPRPSLGPASRPATSRIPFTVRRLPVPAGDRPSARRPPSSAAALTLALAIVLAAGAPARAATLRGAVTDPDGRPTPGARVVLTGAAVSASAVTDDRGRYEMAGLPDGTYDVHVLLAGFRADPTRVELAGDASRSLDLALRLSAVTEAIVVSAAATEMSLSRAPASVTVIEREAIDARQLETVGEALRLVPGMTVVRGGGRGALTSVFPRGAESNSTLVLVDGVRLNAFGGGFDFSELPLGDVERVEIVRGAQSALHGSDAIGAVVQVFTRRGRRGERPHASATLEGGSLGTTHATVTGGGAVGDFVWGASGERLATDGFTGIAPATGESVVNDDHRLENVSLNGGWTRRETRVRGDVRLTSSERGAPGPYGSDPLGNVMSIDRVSRGTTDTVAGSGGVTHAWSPWFRQRVEVGAADIDGTFVSPFGRSESGTRRTSFRLQNDLRLSPAVDVAAGVEVAGERARSTFITGVSGATVPVRRRVIGTFGEARYDSGDRAVVTAGLRVEHIRRSALEADPDAFSPRPTFEADTVVSANPKVSVSYYLRPAAARGRAWTRLRVNAGTGIRPPTAFEIAFTDNPSLAPERSRSVDAGIEQALAGGALVVEATAFYNRYDDLIVAVGRSFADASQFRTDNISNARARGLELQAAVRSGWGLEARLGYTWLDTDVLAVDGSSNAAPPPFSVGQPLLRRPRHQGTLDVVLTRDRLTLHGLLRTRGETLDVEPSFGTFGGLFTAPGWATVDAGARLRLAPHVELFGRISNALDRSYEEAFGFPAPGRTLTAGIRIATRQ